MIDKRKCKYIKTIAECHSFSKAAQTLYISQPSLSRLVKKVEDELGVSLFDRDTIPLALTAAGEKYLNYIDRFQALETEMRSDFAAISSGMYNRLVITTLPVLGTYALPKIIPYFVESYPFVDLEIKEEGSNNILQCLEEGRTDIALTNLEPESDILSYHMLCSDPIVLAVPYNEKMQRLFPGGCNDPAHPIPIDLSILEDETLTVLHPWQNMRIVADIVCQHCAFTPKRMIEVPSLASALGLVSGNRGMTFISRSYISTLRPTSPIIYFSVDDKRDFTSILAVFRKDVPNPLADKFCSCASYSLRRIAEST